MFAIGMNFIYVIFEPVSFSGSVSTELAGKR